MNTVLLWKEYREHRVVWLALAFLAGVSMVVLPLALDAPNAARTWHEMAAIIGLVIVWTYGLVSGAMLLAGEREMRTQLFLDTLPLPRGQLFRIKAVAGLLFAGLFALLVGILAVSIQLISPATWLLYLCGLACVALLGLGWGLLFSVSSGSVLGAIGIAMLAQFLCFPLVFGLAALPLLGFVLITGWPLPEVVFHLTTCLLMVVLPWPIALHLYAAPDQSRSLSASPQRQGWLTGWKIAWVLAMRHVPGLALGLTAFCLVGGLTVVLNPWVLWPLASLLLGVLCAVLAFSDEQEGPFRFLGDQRFPLGPIWATRLLTRAGLALVGSVILLAPAFFTAMTQFTGETNPRMHFLSRMFGNPLVDVLLPLEVLLLGPLAHGFALGHLAGLLFRKPLVAVVVGTGLALLLAAIWVPSAMTGGLTLLQVLAVPAVVLVLCRLLLRDWVADRLSSRSGVLKLLLGTSVAAVLLTAGILWRFLGVPLIAEPPSVPALLADLPVNSEAVNLLRTACGRLEDLRRTWQHRDAAGGVAGPGVPGQPGGEPLWGPELPLIARQIVQRGWPDKDAPLKETVVTLDKLFQDDCWKQFAKLRELPPGVILDPKTANFLTMYRTTDPSRLASSLLAARGLMVQKVRQQPGVFLDDLATALAISANQSNHAPALGVLVARAIESEQCQALEHWLARLKPDVALLRRAGSILDQHNKVRADSAEDTLSVEYLMARNTLDHAGEWLNEILPAVEGRRLSSGEVATLGAMFQVPWERYRQERILRLIFGESQSWIIERYSEHQLLLSSFRWFASKDRARRQARWQARWDASRLQVALRLYQAEKGKPATSLDQLVPAYLSEVPRDPYDGQPFRYRLSAGEEIIFPDDEPSAGGVGAAMPGGGAPGDLVPPGGQPPGMGEMGGAAAGGPVGVQPTRKIPAGQGILWCIGEDKMDNGARQQGWSDQGRSGAAGEDFIFLVPGPPVADAGK